MLLFFLKCLTFILVSTVNGSIVNTKSGPVEGVKLTTPLGKNVEAFFGIPYAEPPTGNLRFKPPVPVKAWDHTFKAKELGKSCVQFVPPAHIQEGMEWWVPPSNETSEDCLNLNIWVPNPVPKDAAVMVWIYGGGFEGGSSATFLYDGQLMASEGGVIFVSMNYRLGPLGFLYLDNEESPGNMGLMDQALALKWVQNNIEAFGGDKRKGMVESPFLNFGKLLFHFNPSVTVFGESAGGASSSYHLTIPSSHGLFKRVISMSGTSNAVWGSNDKNKASRISERLAQSSNCQAAERKDMVNCLRKLSSEDLVKIAFDTPSDGILSHLPVIDGDYLEDRSEKLIEIVDKNIEVMLGTTTDDGLMFPILEEVVKPVEDSYIDSEQFLRYIKATLGLKDEQASVVRHLYTDWEDPEDKRKMRKQLIHFATDLFFLCDTNRFNDALARHGNKIFRYRFGQHPSIPESPKWMGAGHGDEIVFVFGFPLVKGKGYTQKEAELSKTMLELWTNFAKYGDPNGPSKAADRKWPQYSIKGRKQVLLDDTLKLKVGSGKDLRIQECALYDKLLPQLRMTINKEKFCASSE